VKPGVIVVRVGVGRWTVAMDQLDEVRVNDNPSATLLRPDGRSGTAQVHARGLVFVSSKPVRRRIVPLLARREAGDGLAISEHSQVAHAMLLVGGALVDV